MKTSMTTLLYKHLGLMDYLAALGLQEQLVALKQREPSPDILLFVEHSHVYTLGRGGKESNVLAPDDVPVYRTGRGGDVTYHGPGQLVVYPIIDLRSKLRKDVHRYVKNLEMSAIRTLADFGLEGTRRPPFTGILIDPSTRAPALGGGSCSGFRPTGVLEGATGLPVGLHNRKIAAIGVAVRRCITYHGLALNVNTDLSYFNRIVPCGLAWAEVTSMAKELGAELDQREVRDRFLHHFAEVFDYGDLRESPIAEDGGWRVEDGHPRSSIINPRYA